MGKYIRKAKLSGEVVVMEVSAQSTIGVRTRARTLALQRREKTSCYAVDNSSFSTSSYLQLRNRRLEKPSATLKPKELAVSKRCVGLESSPETDDGMEPSFGENVLELEARDRNSRETTPCSSIRKSETIRAPSSTTRLTRRSTFNHGVQNVMHQDIPSTHELEEFFAGTELLRQRTFMEKYNYDPVNDVPLPGRYEWVKLDSN